MAKKYELEDLLRVRVIRKDRAEKNLKQAKLLLEEAERAVAKARQELEDYKIFVKKEGDRMYNEIIKKSVHRRDIDNLHLKIQVLKNRVFEYERRVEMSIVECNKARENVENKRQELRKAERNVDKIESLKEIWIEEMKKEEERQLDLEMEDLIVKLKAV